MRINDPPEATATSSPRTSERGLRVLHTLAVIALVAGAVGSVGFMLSVGHRNPSRLLIFLFLIWDLSPFAGAVIVDIVSRRWQVIPRATLYVLMLVLSLGSLALYGDVVLRPRPQPAFMFLVVPAGSWLIMLIVVSLATLLSRRQSRRGDQA